MARVLPYVQSPLEQLMPYIGQLGQGVGTIGEKIFQNKASKELMNDPLISGVQSQASQQNPSEPGQAIQAGAHLQTSPAQYDALYAKALKAYKGDPVRAKLLVEQVSKQHDRQHQEALLDKKIEAKRTEKAEPELLEREKKLEGLEQEGLRFERLQELFRPELEDKFPSSLSVGLLTKDGELRPTATAILSPEAQEAVKLVTDQIKGAKDTFGARVTNFDATTYLKTLPSLLNNAEGRRRVLRDLRLMNKLNTMREQGVLDIVEREGGPSKISLSQAERRFRKENAKEIDEIKKEFVNPEKNAFSSFPDAKVYSGRQLVDEETGEKYRSNGKEWVPE